MRSSSSAPGLLRKGVVEALGRLVDQLRDLVVVLNLELLNNLPLLTLHELHCLCKGARVLLELVLHLGHLLGHVLDALLKLLHKHLFALLDAQFVLVEVAVRILLLSFMLLPLRPQHFCRIHL